MTRRINRRLQRLEELFSTEPSTSPEEFLVVKEWLASEMEDALPETTLKNIPDEEHFYKWLEELPMRLAIGLSS